jgi:hypothetical protein
MRNIRTLPQLLFRIFIRPVFPFGQWLFRVSGLVREAKSVEGAYRRQPYLIGVLKDPSDVKSVETQLGTHGFFPNRVAFIESGQVLSMRRLADDHADRQYHIRVFSDGEVRGHYEYTPEDRPFAHLNEELYEPRKEAFLPWLGNLLKDS